MALKVGSADVADVKLGAVQVAKVMLGAEQVWPVGPITGYWISRGNHKNPDDGMYGVRDGYLWINRMADADGNVNPGLDRIEAGWTVEAQGEDGSMDQFVVSDAYEYQHAWAMSPYGNDAAYNGRTLFTFTPPTP